MYETLETVAFCQYVGDEGKKSFIALTPGRQLVNKVAIQVGLYIDRNFDGEWSVRGLRGDLHAGRYSGLRFEKTVHEKPGSVVDGRDAAWCLAKCGEFIFRLRIRFGLHETEESRLCLHLGRFFGALLVVNDASPDDADLRQ